MNEKNYFFKANGYKVEGAKNLKKFKSQIKKIATYILKKEGKQYHCTVDYAHNGDDFLKHKITVRIKLKTYKNE